MLNYPKLTCYNLIIRRQVTFIIIIIIIIIVIRLIMTIIMTMIMLMIMIMIMTGSLWMLISFYGIRWQASESFMRPNGDLHALLDLGGSTSWSWWYHFLCRQYPYHFSIRLGEYLWCSCPQYSWEGHLTSVEYIFKISPCSTEVRWPSKNSRAAPFIFASLGS